MYKLYLNNPDVFITTPDADVKKFLLSEEQVDAVFLGENKNPIQGSILYKNFSEVLSDFIVEEAEIEGTLLTITNANLETTFIFEFETEDNGSLTPCSMDPEEQEETWEARLEIISVKLVTVGHEELRETIENYFLEVFKKENRVKYLLND